MLLRHKRESRPNIPSNNAKRILDGYKKETELLKFDLSLKLRRKRSCEIKKFISPIASSAYNFLLKTHSIITSQSFIQDPVKHLRWSIL